MATAFKVVPVSQNKKDKSVTVVMAEPQNPATLDSIRSFLGVEVKGAIASEADVMAAIERLYAGHQESIQDVVRQIEQDKGLAAFTNRNDNTIDLEAIEEMAEAAPVRKLINMVLLLAIKDKASDIHFEPFEDEFKMRYRIDGVLYEMTPPPSQIAPALWKIVASGSFLVPLGQTLGMLLIGYTIACVAGVALGLLMGCSDYLYGLLEPLVEVIRPIPKPALIPAMVVFLGIGAGMKITMVALAALFPVLINTLQGVRGVDPVLLATARTLGCSRLATIRKIILPASLPMILTGMRVSLSMGLVLVILAEMLAAESGIGFLILDLQRSFQVRPMYAWITILAAVGLVLNVLFEMVEDCAVPWRAK